MIRFKHLAVAAVMVTALVLSGCSKYTMYRMAIDSGRSQADLTLKKAAVSIGDVVYLDNAGDGDDGKDRDVILMIHGFGGDKDNWIRLCDKMPAGYRFLVPDLPGHGESASDLSNTYTIENQARWLAEFLAALNVDTVHLVGNSMGGAIGIRLALDHPDTVRTLTLLDSAGVFRTESEFIQMVKQGVNPLVVSSEEDFKRLMNLVMEKKPYIPGPIFDVLAEKKIARKDKDEKIFTDMQADILTMENRLSDLSLPTLIVWGDHDRVLHVDNASVFHEKIGGSRLTILKNIGHLPMLEDPKKTAAVYDAFLSDTRNKR
ncbi:alpha/beta fold hydrolase [Desulfatiferula olefinivorans]